MTKVIEKLRMSKELFDRSGIDEPMKEAEVLIRHAIGMDTVRIYRDNPLLDKEQDKILNETLRRRAMHEPLQYITGYVDFLAIRIMVGEGVLIPRPETEVMAEQAIKTVKSQKSEVRNHSSLRILDLCTGSGCLALALAKEFPDTYVYGSDISRIAIGYAEKNALMNNIRNVRFLAGDLFTPFKHEMMFDLIISNPPYIRTEDIKGLQPEIRLWEPLRAIDGGEDGLDYYRRIIPEAPYYLKDNGMLIMEICPDGLKPIMDMLKKSGYRETEVFKDYAGMERIVMAQWKS